MNSNAKALLKRNLLFFSEAKQRAMINQPGDIIISKKVIAHINDMIDAGEVASMLNAEAVYEYCFDKMKQDANNLEVYAREIASFLC